MAEKINIGDGQWVEFEIMPGDRQTAINIDPLLDDTWKFWQLFQTECDVACCGIGAFRFCPADVRIAGKTVAPGIAQRLSALRLALNTLNASTVTSARLNQLFDKAALVRLVDHVIMHV